MCVNSDSAFIYISGVINKVIKSGEALIDFLVPANNLQKQSANFYEHVCLFASKMYNCGTFLKKNTEAQANRSSSTVHHPVLGFVFRKWWRAAAAGVSIWLSRKRQALNQEANLSLPAAATSSSLIINGWQRLQWHFPLFHPCPIMHLGTTMAFGGDADQHDFNPAHCHSS